MNYTELEEKLGKQIKSELPLIEAARDPFQQEKDLVLRQWMQDVTSLLCYQPEVPYAHKESLVKALDHYIKLNSRELQKRECSICNGNGLPKHYKVFRTAKAKSLMLRALALSPDHALNIAAAHFTLGKGAYAVEDKEVE